MYNSNRVQVYHEDVRVGEMEIYPPPRESLKERKKKVMEEVKMGIRISRFSQPSNRCNPLAVLTTISSSGLCFKLEASATPAQYPLSVFHSSCLSDNKTAVMSLGGEELHLVAMCSENIYNDRPCFWAFSVAPGVYDSCLDMLNLRCLSIVFDLDETLVVANTMHTFEVKIEGLKRRINSEMDPRRLDVMVAEIKRYQEDKNLLKQYVESDQVVENGEVIKVQSEIVPALSDNHQPLVRPLIRLQEKNIVLTRINPMNRDTSVLVRLRSSWEELRSYLTANGRKRFEVYVCTMAERDYALEMWRLLDPEGNLINANDLLARIVCVKSGCKKSLLNVFLNATCHPKMAMVIDDRLNVWDEKDQPRVHVVPAFAPYRSPQTESAATPVLCVARNLACGVRGGFFKDFDDSLLPRIAQISYENDVEDIPLPPDVSYYLVSEEAIFGSSAVLPAANMDTRIDAPVQQLMASASYVSAPVPVPVVQHAAQPSAITFPSIRLQQPASVAKHFVPSEPSLQTSPSTEEGEVPESELDPDTRRRLLILQHGKDTRDASPSEPSIPKRRSVTATENSVGVLHEIASKCGSKVDYKLGLVASTDLRFSAEAWFCGRKIGEGIGKSRREAVQKAAEDSIKNLANIHTSLENGDARPSHRDASPLTNGIVIMGNANTLDNQPFARDETAMQVPSRPTDTRLEGSMRHTGSIPALRKLVKINGRVLGEGVGSTWDEARMQATEKALGNVRPMLQRQESPSSFGGMSNKRMKPDFQRSMQWMPSSERYP